MNRISFAAGLLMLTLAACAPAHRKAVEDDFAAQLEASFSSTKAEQDDFDYFPALTIVLVSPATTPQDAETAVVNFLQRHGGSARSDWSPVQASSHYYFVQARQDRPPIIYMRKGGKYVRYFRYETTY